jgi:hypothetical protein
MAPLCSLTLLLSLDSCDQVEDEQFVFFEMLELDSVKLGGTRSSRWKEEEPAPKKRREYSCQEVSSLEPNDAKLGGGSTKDARQLARDKARALFAKIVPKEQESLDSFGLNIISPSNLLGTLSPPLKESAPTLQRSKKEAKDKLLSKLKPQELNENQRRLKLGPTKDALQIARERSRRSIRLAKGA